MKIIYIGAVDFSYHCLCEVLKSQGNVVGIITSNKNKNNSDYCDLTPISNHHNIPIHYSNNINDIETIKWIKNKNPDIIFCWGWSQLIKTELLSFPPMGIIGVHPTLLPKNRGRHPLIWSLALGLKESGLTFFFMNEEADSGPIISQKKFEITKKDTANTLYKKIKHLAKIQIGEFFPHLISGDYNTTTQNSEKANYWRKRSVNDGMIDWRMNKIAILNLVRALTKPYSGASFNYKEKIITVWTAHEYEKEIFSNIEPGKIFLTLDESPVIKCYDGAIVIDKYEPIIKFNEGEYIK